MVSTTPATTTAPARTRQSPAKWLRTLGWRHLVGVIAVAFAVFPVIWVMSASVNPAGTLLSQKLRSRTCVVAW